MLGREEDRAVRGGRDGSWNPFWAEGGDVQVVETGVWRRRREARKTVREVDVAQTESTPPLAATDGGQRGVLR